MDINLIQNEINNCQTAAELETVRIKYLGRTGLINAEFAKIKTATDPKQFGIELNELKKSVEELLNNKTVIAIRQPAEKQSSKESQSNTHSLPKVGHLHPITITERLLNKAFKDLGFSIYNGPEIETDEYCFQRLNVPLDHPAREMQDTIYIREPDVLLRTQGSSIESRVLSQEKPPFKVAFPCIVYRNEKVTKSNHFIFHHYQGVVVGQNITMKDLFGTINKLFQSLYGPEVKVRFRTKYYPEVEPGVGPDMQCFNCKGAGCGICKGVGWIEMGGAGIIHPKVLKMAGIDPTVYRGFAFGLGLDRWVMANHNIKDIRTLLGGNLAYKPNSL